MRRLKDVESLLCRELLFDLYMAILKVRKALKAGYWAIFDGLLRLF